MARRYSTVTWTEICAFWGMVIAGFTKFFGGMCDAIVSWTDITGTAHDVLTKLVTALSFVGEVALVVAIAVPAYQFVKYKSKGWRIFYWIAFVIFIVAVVLGHTVQFIVR